MTRAQEAEELFTTRLEVFKLRKQLKELIKEDQVMEWPHDRLDSYTCTSTVMLPKCSILLLFPSE